MDNTTLIPYKQSEMLTNRVNKAFSGWEDREQLFHVEMTFTNPGNKDFKLTDAIITRWGIVKDYEQNYVEDHKLLLTLTMPDFVSLMDNYEHLECTIIYKYLYGSKDFNDKIDPIVKKYRAIVLTPDDLKKKLPAYRINTGRENRPQINVETETALIQCTIQLVSEFNYHLKHRHIHGLFRGITIKKMIEYSIAAFGIKKKRIIKPDNETVYNNLYIPPVKTVASLYNYLQNEKGIYTEGMSYFIDNGIFYMYPTYRLPSEEKKILHIYKIMPGSHPAMGCYHNVDKDPNIVHVICNTNVNIETQNAIREEQIGNTRTIIEAKCVVEDKFHDMIGEEFFIEDNTGRVYTLPNGYSNIKDASNSKFVDPTDNIYRHLSELTECRCMYVTMIWHNCDWRLLTPGMRVKYHYDETDSTYVEKEGILVGAIYRFKMQPTSNKGFAKIFSCTATLRLRLETT